MVAGPSEPAASAVPAASAEDNQQDDDDQNSGAIHVNLLLSELLSLLLRGHPAPGAATSRIWSATFNFSVLPNFGLIVGALNRGQRLRSRRDRPDGLERIDRR